MLKNINAEMIDEWDDKWSYEEGCLSIPDIRGDVERHKKIRIRFQDLDFNEHEQVFDDIENLKALKGILIP